MWAFAKAILLLSRYFRRMANAQEELVRLYKLDLAARGIDDIRYDPTRKPEKGDMAEIMYGVKEEDPYDALR